MYMCMSVYRHVCMLYVYICMIVYNCILGWPLANGGKMKVTNLTVPPFEMVPIIIKKIRAKYFDDCIIFRGVPQALKFTIENVMACITSQVYFRKISFSS